MADGSLAAVGGRIQDVDTLRMMYFGLPSNPDPSYNQYGRMSDTYKTFPQAWGGPYATQSPHISNVLIHKLSKTDDLMLNELMPLRVAPDGPTKFAITLIEYNSNRWTNVPHLGVPELTSQQSSSRQVTLGRQGLAFFMENGFLMTAKGQLDYLYSVQQVTNGLARALVWAAYNALLSTVTPRTNIRTFSDHLGGIAGPAASIDRVIDLEVQLFGCLNKKRDAMTSIREMLDTISGSTGVTFTHLIVPRGTKRLIASHPDQFEQSKVGALRTQGLDGSTKAADPYFRGIQVVEVVPFPGVGPDDPLVDPLVRQRTIGTFFQIQGPANRLRIHDLDTDQMVTLRRGEDLGASMFWSPGIAQALLAAAYPPGGAPADATLANYAAQVGVGLGGVAADVANLALTAIDTPTIRAVAARNPDLFGYVVFRPFERHLMGSAIAIRAREAGFTMLQNLDTTVQQDGVRKGITSTSTAYLGAVVTDKYKVKVIPNISFMQYSSGGGTVPYDSKEEILASFRRQGGEATKALIVCPILPNEELKTKHMDICGQWPDGWRASTFVSGAGHRTPLVYCTGQAFGRHLGFQPAPLAQAMDIFFEGKTPSYTTRVSQGHQYTYRLAEDAAGNNVISAVQRKLGKGGAGASAYEGARADLVRSGEHGYLLPSDAMYEKDLEPRR